MALKTTIAALIIIPVAFVASAFNYKLGDSRTLNEQTTVSYNDDDVNAVRGLYVFDHDHGTNVYDFGLYTNDGFALSVAASPSFVTNIGGALSFDGVNDAVNINKVRPMLAGTRMGTWAATIVPTRSNSAFGAMAVGDFDSGSTYGYLGYSLGGFICRMNLGSALVNVTTVSDYPTGVAYRVVGVQDGVALRVFVDGAPVATTTSGSFPSAWINALGGGVDVARIGSVPFANGEQVPWPGLISEVLFATNVWTDAYIATDASNALRIAGK